MEQEEEVGAKARRGEEEYIEGWLFPATTSPTEITFRGSWITVYHAKTKERLRDFPKSNITQGEKFTIPADHIFEVSAAWVKYN